MSTVAPTLIRFLRTCAALAIALATLGTERAYAQPAQDSTAHVLAIYGSEGIATTLEFGLANQAFHLAAAGGARQVLTFCPGGTVSTSMFGSNANIWGRWQAALRGAQVWLDVWDDDGVARLQERRAPSRRMSLQLDSVGGIAGFNGWQPLAVLSGFATCEAGAAAQLPIEKAKGWLINRRLHLRNERLDFELALCDGGSYFIQDRQRGKRAGSLWRVGDGEDAKRLNARAGLVAGHNLYLLLRPQPGMAETIALPLVLTSSGIASVEGMRPVISPLTGGCQVAPPASPPPPPAAQQRAPAEPPPAAGAEGSDVLMGTWVGPTTLEVTAEGHPTYGRCSGSRIVLTHVGQRFSCTDKRYGDTRVEVSHLRRGPDFLEYSVGALYGGGPRIVPGFGTDASLSRTLKFHYMFKYRDGVLNYTVKDDVFSLVEQGTLKRQRRAGAPPRVAR